MLYVFLPIIIVAIVATVIWWTSRRTSHHYTPSSDYNNPQPATPEPPAASADPSTVSIMSSRPPRMYFGSGPTMELRRASEARDYTAHPSEKVFVELDVFAAGLCRAFNWGQMDLVRMRVNDLGAKYVASMIKTSGNTRVDDRDACSICACTFDGVSPSLWITGSPGQKVLNRVVFEFSFDGGKTWGFPCEACVFLKY